MNSKLLSFRMLLMLTLASLVKARTNLAASSSLPSCQRILFNPFDLLTISINWYRSGT